MKIDDIKPTSKKLFRIPADEIESLESSLWITLPDGYRDYMTRLGDGVLGSFVRIYTPAKIRRELNEWRERVNKHWFWNKGKKLLPKDRALECMLVGDTTSGDELVFHPNRPGKLFVLPSESEQIYDAGNNLTAAIEWACSSGKLVEPFSDWTFEPSDSKKESKQKAKKSSQAGEGAGESIGEIAKRGRDWMNRNAVAKLAKKQLKVFLDPGQELKLVQEGIGWALNEPAYVAVFKIKEKNGRLAGVLAFHTNDGIHGGGERLA